MTNRPLSDSLPSGGLRASVAAALRSDLAAGRFRPGDRLPSEADLAARFGVHRNTVREALARLGREGLVAARRGAGSFVLGPPTDYPIGARVRFSQNIRAAGRTPSHEGLVLATRAADEAEARALVLAPGDPVHAWEGVSLADGEPVALFRSVFPAARLPGLAAHLAREGSVTAALAACGIGDYRRLSTRMVAALALPHQAARLRLARPAALLRTTQVSVDAEGRPVEFGTTWFAGDRVALVWTEP